MGKIALLDRHEQDARPEGVRTQWMLITPHYAQKVLDDYEQFCDTHPDERKNRPVHQGQVNKYVADIKSGKWGRHHQGIAFDKNGILIDGQHRLWAVVESGETIMMLVTHGLDREAQLTIDSGLKRSTADVAAIAGFAGVRDLQIAVVKVIARGTAATRPGWTRLQELELLREHWKALDFVMSCFPKRKLVGLSRAPVLGAIARAWYTEDEARLRRFVEVLIEGIPGADPHEHVIITLRTWLHLNRRGGSANALDAYGKTQRALQAFLRGERIRTLYASREDLFPLPATGRRK